MAAKAQPQPGDNGVYLMKVTNSDGQLVKDSEIKSGYTRIPDDDVKNREWKTKLGARLRDELLPPGDPRRGYTCSLESFPEHYHLRVGVTNPNGSTRHDWYLYGYPEKGKYFKSANEFFPHLLWLSTGTKDKSQCSCRFCNTGQKKPDLAKELKLGQVRAAVQLAPSPAPPSSSVSSAPAVPSSSAQIYPPKLNPAPSTSTASPATQMEPAAPHPNNPVDQRIPTPAAAVSVTTTRELAVTDDSLIFREGEMVWFRHDPAWRIGVVMPGFHPEDDGRGPRKHLIKPLAHAFRDLMPVVRLETEMRPFLAFSVPTINIKDLNGKRHSEVPWNEWQQQFPDAQRRELVGIEASKLVAIEIDHAYSVFNPIAEAQPDSNAHFGGVFLGAERIHLGEAIRLRLANTEMNPNWAKGMPVVMVLRDIAVMKFDGQPETLYLTGDVYRLEELPPAQPGMNNGYPPGPSQDFLPGPMSRERAFRERIARVRTPGAQYQWTLMQENSTKMENSVRGRFYETERLMPILNQADFMAKVQHGIVPDVQAYLNNRLDSILQNNTVPSRHLNRRQTLSTAVPHDFPLNLGLAEMI